MASTDGPWVRFFPSDWLGGTRGMSAAETGVYITLVCLMYERMEPVERDDNRQARLCGVPLATYRKILDTLLGEGKVTTENGGLWNNRVAVELQNRVEISDAARKKANARWEKSEQKQEPQNAAAMQGQSTSNANHNHNHNHIDTSVPSVSGKPSAQKPTAKSELMMVLDAEHAQDVIDHRNKIKKPMTPKAAKMLATKLGSFDEPNKAADFMIEKGWQSIEREWVVNAMAQQRQAQAKPHGADAFGDLAEFYRAQAIREGEDSGSTDRAVQDVPKLAHHRA